MVRKVFLALGGLSLLAVGVCTVFGVWDARHSESWIVRVTPAPSRDIAEALSKVLERRASSLSHLPASAKQTAQSDFLVVLRGSLPESLDTASALTMPGQLKLWVVDERVKGPYSPREDQLELRDPRDPSAFFLVSRAAPRLEVDDARVSFGSDRRPNLLIALSDHAGREFQAFSRGHIGRQVVLVLDDQVLAAPMMREEVNRHLHIDLGFKEGQASEVLVLASVLTGGPLPQGISVVAQKERASPR